MKKSIFFYSLSLALYSHGMQGNGRLNYNDLVANQAMLADVISRNSAGLLTQMRTDLNTLRNARAPEANVLERNLNNFIERGLRRRETLRVPGNVEQRDGQNGVTQYQTWFSDMQSALNRLQAQQEQQDAAARMAAGAADRHIGPDPVAVVVPPHDNHRPGGGGAAAVHVDNSPWGTLSQADRDALIGGLRNHIIAVWNIWNPDGADTPEEGQRIREQALIVELNDNNLDPGEVNVNNLVQFALNANDNLGQIWNQLPEGIRQFYMNRDEVRRAAAAPVAHIANNENNENNNNNNNNNAAIAPQAAIAAVEARLNAFPNAIKEFTELMNNPTTHNELPFVLLDDPYLKRNDGESDEDFKNRILQTTIDTSKLERDGTLKGFPVIFTLNELDSIISKNTAQEVEGLTPNKKRQLEAYADSGIDSWRRILQCHFLDFQRNPETILNLLGSLKNNGGNNRLTEFLYRNCGNQNYFDENLQSLYQDFILQLLLDTQKTGVFGEYAAFFQEIFKNFGKILKDIVLDRAQRADTEEGEVQREIETATKGLTQLISKANLNNIFTTANVLQFVYSHLLANNENQPLNGRLVQNPMALTYILIKMPPVMVLRMLNDFKSFETFCGILDVLNEMSIDSENWNAKTNELYENPLAKQICAIFEITSEEDIRAFWTNQIQKFKSSNPESHLNDDNYLAAQTMRLALSVYKYLKKYDQARRHINLRARSIAIGNIEEVTKAIRKHTSRLKNFQENYKSFFKTEKKNKILHDLQNLGKKESQNSNVLVYTENLGKALIAASERGVISGVQNYSAINTILSETFKLYFPTFEFSEADNDADGHLRDFVNGYSSSDFINFILTNYSILGCVNPFALADGIKLIDEARLNTPIALQIKNQGETLRLIPTDLLNFILTKCEILDYNTERISEWLTLLPTKDRNEMINIMTADPDLFAAPSGDISPLLELFRQAIGIFNNNADFVRQTVSLQLRNKKDNLNKLFQYMVDQSFIDEDNDEDDQELISLSDILSYKEINSFKCLSHETRPDTQPDQICQETKFNTVSDEVFMGLMSTIPNDLKKLKLIRFYTNSDGIGEYVISGKSFENFCKNNPQDTKNAYLLAMFVSMLKNGRFFSAFDAIAKEPIPLEMDVAANFDHHLHELVINHFTKDYKPICSNKMQVVFPTKKIGRTALEDWSDKYSLDALVKLDKNGSSATYGSTVICSKKDNSEIAKFDEDMIVNFAASLWEFTVLAGNITLDANGNPTKPSPVPALKVNETPITELISNYIKTGHRIENRGQINGQRNEEDILGTASNVLWGFMRNRYNQSALISTMVMCDGDAAANDNSTSDFARHALTSIEKLRSAYAFPGSIQFVQVPAIVRYLLPKFVDLIRFSRDYFEPNQIFLGMLETLSTWNGYFIEGLHHCDAGQFDAIVRIFGQYLNDSKINDFLIHIVGNILGTNEEQRSNMRKKISEILLSGRNELKQADFSNIVSVNDGQLKRINKILEPAIAIKWDSDNGIKLVFTLISNSLASSIFGEINEKFLRTYKPGHNVGEQAMYIACMMHNLLGWAGTMYQKGIAGWSVPVSGFIGLIEKYSAKFSNQQCDHLLQFYPEIFKRDEQTNGQGNFIKRFTVKPNYFDFNDFLELSYTCYERGKALDPNETNRRNKLLGVMNALYSVVVCHSIAKDYTAAAEVIVDRFCRDHSDHAARLGLNLLSFKKLCPDPANDDEGLAKQAQVLQDIFTISTIINDPVLGGYFKASPEDEQEIRQKLGL